MRKKVSEIITPEQRKELEQNGWVVVHQHLTKNMLKAMLDKNRGFGANAAYDRTIRTSLLDQKDIPDEALCKPYKD